MERVTQYIVQTTTKRSGWGWEGYFKTQKDAQACYEQRLADKSFSTVRMYKETFMKTGGK